jgi:hypothetical protein
MGVMGLGGELPFVDVSGATGGTGEEHWKRRPLARGAQLFNARPAIPIFADQDILFGQIADKTGLPSASNRLIAVGADLFQARLSALCFFLEVFDLGGEFVDSSEEILLALFVVCL